MELFKDHICGNERRKNIPNVDVAVVDAHYYVMVIVAHIDGHTIGTQIFPQSIAGALISDPVQTALEKVVGLTGAQDVSNMHNKRVNNGNYSQFLHRYMDRASGCLQNNIICKFYNAFFAGIPFENPLSSNSRTTWASRRDFERELDEKRDYYRSPDYSGSWINASTTAICERLSSSSTATRNVRRHKPELTVPDIPNAPPGQVSLYLLGFLVLNVRFMFFFWSTSTFYLQIHSLTSTF